ncbi:MAG: ImmA/IrrE family metallo-endopeptidase [Oscillospiraceae bacterium]|nr:ImmA/IrrE family metallo-endopeptidase [Oscillospiraceae bacterium]
MFEICDFYGFCKAKNVDVIPYDGAPQPGATIRDEGNYAVFLDFTKIRSTRLLRGVCLHELGHVATGALHKVDSPYELVERSEYRANRWATETYLSEEAFREAFAEGYAELWELAEYFDLPEKCVADALTYWKERKGIDFET